jgi:hypothetical protein
MNVEQRIKWCIAQAEEIERDLPPQEDPHMWTSGQLCARFWRDMAWKLQRQRGRLN